MKPRKPVTSATFGGKKYRIFTDQQVDGYCTVGDEPDKPHIVIQAYLTGLRRLEVAIHEALHAIFPLAPEFVVARAARDLARFLWRLGYRLPGDKA